MSWGKGRIESDAVPPELCGKREEPLASDDYNYRFNSNRAGTCIIFNNMLFDKRTGQNVRKGSEKDADRLEETFKQFGFDVHTYENRTCLQMFDIMRKESDRNHGGEDCFVCAILSHGTRGFDGERENDIIWGTDNYMQLEDITRHVNDENCPSLAGKPKIFIVQACRGCELSEAAEFEDVTYSSGERETRPAVSNQGYDEADAVACGPVASMPQTIPIDNDYLLVYSTPPGFFSFRSSTKGSFFISSVCDQLQEFYKHKDVMSIMTRVNHKVAFLYESYVPSSRNDPTRRDMHEKKQMPWVASKLTKFLYFTDK